MKEPEYINREALMKAIGESTEPFTTSMVYRHIQKAPAADVIRRERAETEKKLLLMDAQSQLNLMAELAVDFKKKYENARKEVAEEIFNGLIKVFMDKQRHYENIRRPGKANQMIEAREEIYKFKREYYERSRHERN